MPNLHEMWTWEGDTSVLPHKVVEILNQVSVFDTEDPQFQSDDPFDFERPYRAVEVSKHINGLINAKDFETDSFFFITARSSSVGCCWVNTTASAENPNEALFTLEYIATIPGSQGSGVEQSLIEMAMRYCLIVHPKKLNIELDKFSFQIVMNLDQGYISEHLRNVF